MAMEGDDAARNGAGGRSGGEGVMKKGTWSFAEDAELIKYVEKHGEGNWNAVHKNSGLMRHGKSCRLRWANHLRPNLKKGPFTPEEEQKIVDLHAKYGNKWARMAIHLTGRTDNEIKNYWNTRLKKRQRAGLPIHSLNLQHDQNPNSLSSLLQNSNFYRSHPTGFNSLTFKSPKVAFPYDNSYFKPLHNTNGSVGFSPSSYSNKPFSTLSSMTPMPLSLSSSSNKPFSTSSSIFPAPSYISQALPHTNFNMNALGTSFNGFTYPQTEPPSIQSSPFEAITQTSSTNTYQSEYVFPTSSEADNYENAPEMHSRRNSGLLEDVLTDSQALMNFEKGKGQEIQAWEKMGDLNELDIESILKDIDSNNTSENNLENSSTGHSSFDPIVDFEEMHFLTEADMSSLLDDLPISEPISEPISDFYAVNDDASTGKSTNNVTDACWLLDTELPSFNELEEIDVRFQLE